MKIQIHRDNTLTIELPLNSATFTKKLMAEHELVFSFQSPTVLDIEVGDFLTYDGELMTINKSSDVLRNHLLEYNITFQGHRHTLERFIIKDEGALTFDYTADLETYMFMFLESINSVDSGWTLGDIDEVEPFTLTFDKVDHLTALNMISEGAACEFQFIGKEITVKKTVGVAREYPLAYGKDNGLYSVARKSLENSKIVTRAYAVGGSQNLPLGYAHRQLTLPGYIEDATAVALFGVREGVFEDQNIYPQRTGTATSVGQINEATFTLTDTTIDFDLDGQMIEGTEAKIVFKSGALNGQEFKILAYNHTTKTIRYEANKDSNGSLTPFGLYIAEVGDQYTLVGIRMPESYVNAALNLLEDKRLEYLGSNKVPRVVYEASVDPLDLKRKAGTINEGDILPFTDGKIGLDDNLRVTVVSYPALLPYQLIQGMTFNIEIGQEVTYTRLQKVEKDIKETKEVVTHISRTSSENDRRNAVALQEFKSMVFDPDGNMQEPLLEAIAGVFGTTSQYYDLAGVQITVNGGGDENAIALTAGTLTHRVYKIDGLGYIWDLQPFNASGLDPLKAYYLSAKCSKTALIGEWVLSDIQLGTDDEPGYWHFNLGVLSSVIEGVRSFRPTKLYTVISGGQIETNTLTAYMIDVQRLFAQIITVGSEGFINAGISGLADDGALSQRFWAGATEANRYDAPFSVLNDGSMRALKGKIGNFNMDANRLFIGNEDSWTPYGQSVFLYGNYFLLRDNGAVSGQRRELSWNLYKDQLGQPRASAASIFNTIATATGNPLTPYTNVGLEIETEGGDKNIALDLKKGGVRVGDDEAISAEIPFVAGWTGTTAYWRNFIVKHGFITGVSDPYYDE